MDDFPYYHIPREFRAKLQLRPLVGDEQVSLRTNLIIM